MHDESDFLDKLLDNPADDTARLVYADWLDERGGDEAGRKSEFLRLTARARNPQDADLAQLRALAAALPTDWLAVVSRLKIDHCGEKRAADQTRAWLFRQFEFVCDQEWDAMTPTGDAAVRHCERCKENVYYCDTITAARGHARQGHCVAVDLGIIRRDNDLAPPVGVVGQFTADYFRRERDRLSVDEVSREREERKRKAGG